MPENNELKPCPFCGGEAVLECKNHTGNILKADNGTRFKVFCGRRGCYLRDIIDFGYETKQSAIKDWNTRPALIAQVQSQAGTIAASQERVAGLVGRMEKYNDVLNKVAQVACGEDQIECDGDYNDSDGMKWIYDYITDQVDHFLPDIEEVKCNRSSHPEMTKEQTEEYVKDIQSGMKRAY